jgi:rRNA-processing protein FCF1
MAGQSILIDTNIVIRLEDDRPVIEELSRLLSRCAELNVRVYVHEASRDDISRDVDARRRAITLSKLDKFPMLTGIPSSTRSELEARFGNITNDNDRVDVALLNALDRNVVDFLITEDAGIHKRARDAGLADRVFHVRDAVDWIADTFDATSVELPYILERRCCQLDLKDPIFKTLRDGYPGFDEWFQRNIQRFCWVLEIEGEIAGVIIRKDDEPRRDTDALLSGSKIIKLATFKVSEKFRGQKFGEHRFHRQLRAD